jgi:hypothetical protein
MTLGDRILFPGLFHLMASRKAFEQLKESGTCSPLVNDSPTFHL